MTVSTKSGRREYLKKVKEHICTHCKCREAIQNEDLTYQRCCGYCAEAHSEYMAQLQGYLREAKLCLTCRVPVSELNKVTQKVFARCSKCRQNQAKRQKNGRDLRLLDKLNRNLKVG